MSVIGNLLFFFFFFSVKGLFPPDVFSSLLDLIFGKEFIFPLLIPGNQRGRFNILSAQGVTNGKCQLQIDTCHWHLPSPSTKIKLCVAAAADFQHTLKGVQDGEQK